MAKRSTKTRKPRRSKARQRGSSRWPVIFTAPHAALLRWYDKARRALPWRATSDAYAVWVSEIMLQQTRVETVVPYYERWMKRFPTVRALASASVDTVLKLWEGLGYYTRARNLHRAAQQVVNEFGGRVPDDAQGLRALPGVGRYTAGAIASIAFGRRAAVVDGNVVRVLSRLCALARDPSSAEGVEAFWRLAQEWVPAKRPGDWNQALMELGATVCTPVNPSCLFCPVQSACEARKQGRVDELPVKKAGKALPVRRTVAACVERNNKLLIWRREERGFLGGMFVLPTVQCEAGDVAHMLGRFAEEFGLRAKSADVLGVQTHVYSMFKEQCTPLRLGGTKLAQKRVSPAKDLRWVDRAALAECSIARLHQKILQELGWLGKGKPGFEESRNLFK